MLFQYTSMCRVAPHNEVYLIEIHPFCQKLWILETSLVYLTESTVTQSYQKLRGLEN